MFHSDIFCLSCFVQQIKYNIVCRVEHVEFSAFSVKTWNQQQSCCFVQIKLLIKSYSDWRQMTGWSFLYMDGVLALTFLMWFLHLSRGPLPLPEGCHVTAAFGRRAFRFKKINQMGSSSRKMEESDRGWLPLAADVNPAHPSMNQTGVKSYEPTFLTYFSHWCWNCSWVNIRVWLKLGGFNRQCI